jgi:hypothetical protein
MCICICDRIKNKNKNKNILSEQFLGDIIFVDIMCICDRMKNKNNKILSEQFQSPIPNEQS